MKALVKDNRIVQVATETFPVHPDFQWRDVPNNVTTEWTWNGTEAAPPEPEPASERRSRLKQYLRQLGRRKRAEAVGLAPDVPDAESRFLLMLTESVMLVNDRTAGRGGSARLDNELRPLAQAVLAIAQAQDQIVLKIDNDTYTTEAAIDGAAEWPS